jgi:hypothetical protein
MRRAVFLALVAAAAAWPAPTGAQTSSPPTGAAASADLAGAFVRSFRRQEVKMAPARLRITVWPEGREAGGPLVHTLRCDPAGGTLRRPGAACRRLAVLEQPFAPVPPDTVCTQIFAGPQEALVTGTVAGRKIWARFNRRNGCQADRWNRHAFLFAA